MAILAAFNSSEEVQVVGLTTHYGNVTAQQATLNALSLVEMAGASHVRVCMGGGIRFILFQGQTCNTI